jgi:hypothetical protein
MKNGAFNNPVRMHRAHSGYAQMSFVTVGAWPSNINFRL